MSRIHDAITKATIVYLIKSRTTALLKHLPLAQERNQFSTTMLTLLSLSETLDGVQIATPDQITCSRLIKDIAVRQLKTNILNI
jgi:hypothetical protein